MEEPASAVFSAVSASVRLDAAEDMMRLAIAQTSGQIQKEQARQAQKISQQLKRQASDILEPLNDGNGDIDQLKEIFSKGQ